MPKIKDNPNLYWLYDTVTEEFWMDLIATDVANITGISSGHVCSHADAATIIKGRWMIWHHINNQTPAIFRQSFALPPRIRIDALRPVREYWGDKVAQAYWNKYRYPKQVLLLDEYGKEVRIFDSYQECADHLKIPLGTVRSRLHRATSLTRTVPTICKREDYVTILDKYFSRGNAQVNSLANTAHTFFVGNTTIGWEEQNNNLKSSILKAQLGTGISS